MGRCSHLSTLIWKPQVEGWTRESGLPRRALYPETLNLRHCDKPKKQSIQTHPRHLLLPRVLPLCSHWLDSQSCPASCPFPASFLSTHFISVSSCPSSYTFFLDLNLFVFISVATDQRTRSLSPPIQPPSPISIPQNSTDPARLVIYPPKLPLSWLVRSGGSPQGPAPETSL